MFLVIGFRPGDSVSLAGQHFLIDVSQRCLRDDQGRCHPLSDAFASPAPDVRVRVADPQRWPDMLSLAFEAPRHTLILRHRAGGLQ